MRHAVLLCLCLAAAPASAGAKSRTLKEVNGKAIIPGPAFVATPVVEVGGLRFFACRLAESDAPCTVITGYVISRLPHERFDVEVTVHLQRSLTRTGRLFVEGPGSIRLGRVIPGRKRPFKIVAPPCAPAGKDAAGIVSTYKVSVRAFPFSAKPHSRSPDVTEQGRAYVVPNAPPPNHSNHRR